MKKLAMSALFFAAALPALAQTPAPAAPAPGPPPKRTLKQRFFVGGSVALAFGTVDYIELAPMVGFNVVPHFDVGFQPFYRWMKDSRYSPSVSTTGYGASVFGRVRIVHGLFAEADYQYSNEEYPTGTGGTTRYSHGDFLAGLGYGVSVGSNAGFYTSVLYDFSYNNNNPYNSYDSPLRFQAGMSVGF